MRPRGQSSYSYACTIARRAGSIQAPDPRRFDKTHNLGDELLEVGITADQLRMGKLVLQIAHKRVRFVAERERMLRRRLSTCNPANPGMSFHKLDKAKDKNFWSVRASSDIRLIVHKSDASLLLCYVGHHDEAYNWAERRKLETHPKTGAAQLVEIRETVKEIVVPVYVQTEVAAAPRPSAEEKCIFAGISEDTLLGYDVPVEWLNDIKKSTADTLLALTADARVLLTTFSDTLANALQTKLTRLLGNEPRLGERIDVHSLNAIGLRLYKTHVGQATIASGKIVRELVQEAASAVGEESIFS
jgi:hypothetical protein